MTRKINVKFSLKTDNMILNLKFNAAVYFSIFFVIMVIPLFCIVNIKIFIPVIREVI